MFLFVLNKLKSVLLLVLNVFRRAFCCFRRRRRHSKDEALSHIVVDQDVNIKDTDQWNDWEFKNRKPASVEEHIEYYRQQQAKLRQPPPQDESTKDDMDLFQDMTPNITKQTKVVLTSAASTCDKTRPSNTLHLDADAAGFMTSQLEDWEDNSGWESEALEMDASEILKQKKREERERRLLEQHQKRLERHDKQKPLLGARLVT